MGYIVGKRKKKAAGLFPFSQDIFYFQLKVRMITIHSKSSNKLSWLNSSEMKHECHNYMYTNNVSIQIKQHT